MKGINNSANKEEPVESERILEEILRDNKNQPIDKINRKSVLIGKREFFDKMDNEYWKQASIKEKMQSITYLRECFYGKEATTGRVQRIHKMFKLEYC